MNKDYTEISRKLIDKIEEATNTDYEVIRFYNRIEDKEETYISIDKLIVALEDMYVEYDHMKELYEDLK